MGFRWSAVQIGSPRPLHYTGATRLKQHLPQFLYSMLKKSIRIRNSRIPFYRVLDILATDDGDVSKVANVFSDIKERELREACHNCAQFLRAVEDYATGGQELAAAAQKTPDELTEQTERLKQADYVKIFIDGSSKGNPGPAGIGIVFTTIDGETLLSLSKFIGKATNNYAEYIALKDALLKALEYNIRKVDCFTDSELMANQIMGKFKVRNAALAQPYREVMKLSKSFAHFRINYLKREFNRGADRLASRAVREATKKARESESAT
jgi:ribonuclease HI